ncbi:radical SAM family heme chaperone HemW [Sulfurimonas sp. HSL3-7]|uniref:radical SAM family heme chaperone HemW n=1 Tax=Sulfonitrofixus jiaomeiensis TaxID=3131938 RepID=UPI0031F72596
MLIYIHIPFCDSKCHYCSFNSYVDLFHLRERYMQALMVQLKFELKRFKAEKGSIETVFIGGGTPSTVKPELYGPLFELLAPYIKEGAEITSEANPNSATAVWLEGMHALGVNRISFGVQSFNDEKLKKLGRAHKAEEASKALFRAQKAGFEHLSLDLIYGVENDTQALLEHDLNEAFRLPIDHLSAYALTIEEGTPFASTPDVANEKLALTEWFLQRIKERFATYEISNFGNYHSKHNLGYWEYKDYIGLGSGAVGFLKNERFYPSGNVQAYIDNPLDIQSELLGKEAVKTEKIFLGLRSIVGVDEAILSEKEQEKARLLVKEKKLSYRDGHFYNDDYLLSDELALFIQQ